MEWTMPVNEMLKDDITKLNSTLIPPGFRGDVRTVRLMQESLSRVIDALGSASASAQGLNKCITTAEKLRLAPTHTIYLLKDSSGNNGQGEVVGLLKVGRKHLFLWDERARACEIEPLCVLDFYVRTDRQRAGLGRMLFDHMLLDMEAAPEELAIDGPSKNMEKFLAKNYGLDRLIHQSNNFGVSPHFFEKAEKISEGGRNTPLATAAAVGRFAAPQPASAIASVIHGGGSHFREHENGRVSGRATPAREIEPVLAAAPAPLAKVAASPMAAPAPSAPPVPSAPPLEVDVHQEPAPLPRPSTLPVAPTPTPGSRRDSQLTDRGFFDVKFYHNKLW